jgi:hypothetical protein
MRTLADILTALWLAVAATLIGWTVDTVDGHLARAAPNPVPSLVLVTFAAAERPN